MKERTMIRVLIAAVCVWIGLMLVTGDFAFTGCGDQLLNLAAVPEIEPPPSFCVSPRRGPAAREFPDAPRHHRP
ncbi:MAG: hypothetical protein OXH52_07740, partial [Gammaproteobacteria bacterium]|nr:hypothetical protein [Gammaproteobacteria bacterium]